jgi:hypothetical protein
LKTRWKHPQPMLILLPIWLMIRHWSDAWGWLPHSPNRYGEMVHHRVWQQLTLCW